MFKTIARIARIAPLALAAIPLVALVQPAQAAQPQTTVIISDLDFGRARDIVEFEDRVFRAGDTLCTSMVRNNQARSPIPHKQCVNRARAQAVAQLPKAHRDAVLAARTPSSRLAMGQ